MRYAEAFYNIAEEHNKIDEYQQELELVVKTIEEMENLREYMDHFLIPVDAKKEVISKIFADNISVMTLNFLHMIIDKRREAYLDFIVEEYQELTDIYHNISKAELISAQEVPEDAVQDLVEKLSISTGKIVQLKQTIDPLLIGGIKIRIGDQIIDATVAKKLEMLKTQLKEAKIS